jgi:hypothetical protein
VLAAALDKDPDRRISEIEELERRFRNAIQESGFSVEKPTPVFASQPPVQKRSAPAMATTLIGQEKAAAPAFPQLAARRSVGAGASAEPSVHFSRPLCSGNAMFPSPVKWLTYALLIMVHPANRRRTWHVGMDSSSDRVSHVAKESRQSGSSRNSECQCGSRIRPDQASAPGSIAPNNIPPRGAARCHEQSPQVTPSPSGCEAQAARSYSPATMRQIPASQRMVDITTSLSISLAAVILVTAAVHLATPLLPGVIDVAFFGVVTLLALSA